MFFSAGSQGNEEAKTDEVNLLGQFFCLGVEDNADRLPVLTPFSRVPFCIAEAGRPKLHFPEPLVPMALDAS